MPTPRLILSPSEPDAAAKSKCALVIMSKAPRAGEVKTRLSPPLTPQEAAALNGCFLRDIAAAIYEAGDHARGIVCYTPLGSEEIFWRLLPTGFQLLEQRGEDLSARINHALGDLFAIGFGAVCLINSDSPIVTSAMFARAANLLLQPHDRVVLGPSDDGGYYLIGMKKLHSRLYEEIEWSTHRVFAQTLERAAEIGLEVRLLPANYDVDDRAALHRLCDDLFNPDKARDIETAFATREFLREIIDREGRQRIWPVTLDQGGGEA